MCGIFGVFGHPQGKVIAKTGSWTIQSRGQGAAGITCLKILSEKRGLIEVHKKNGKVREVLNGPEYDDLEGDAWIAHIRYPTQGGTSRRNAQPHYTQTIFGKIAIASNGDVVNMDEQRSFLDHYNIRTYTENDAEIIAAAINYQVTVKKRDMVEAIMQVMEHVRGAFSALAFCEFDNRLFAFRDPHGIRPLFLACVVESGQSYWMFSSETASFDATLPLFGPQAKIANLRSIKAGEIVAVGPNGIQSFQGPISERQAFCLFEYIYFSRPDSMIGGRSFASYRQAAGQELFKEKPIAVDQVSPIPKSGIPSAEGYALTSKIPYISSTIIVNPSFDIDFEKLRTFIESEEQARILVKQLKHSFTFDLINGRRMTVHDDSTVRGLTARLIVQGLWERGAKEAHVCIASPPYRFPCFYGIETKDKRTLVAAGRTEEEVRQLISCPTTLNYLSLEGLIKSIGLPKNQLCTACFDGNYPIPVKSS